MPRHAPASSTSRTPARSTSSTTARKPAVSILDMLTADHKKVKKMFRDFEKIKGDAEVKQQLVQLCCAEVSVHAELEEALFYPALRRAVRNQDLLNEAQVEHDSARQLIAELSLMQPDEQLYDAKFTVLGEYLAHHIEEEETKIFAMAKKSRLDLESMGEEARQLQQELRSAYGLPEQETDAGKRHQVH